ncbi:MAG: ATP-binding protein [Pseudomonadota bacterium]
MFNSILLTLVSLLLISTSIFVYFHLQNKRKMSRYRRERNLLNAILKGMYEGVIVINSEGHVVLANDSMKKIFPIPLEYKNKHLLEVINNSQIYQLFDEIRDGAEFVSKEVKVNEEEDFSLYANLSAISQDKKIDAVVGVFHNISKIRKLEKMRRYLIANLSHEFKTPLASIKGYSETLLSGALDDKETARQFIKIIEKNCNFLIKLIEEMLQLSKLDTGQYKVEYSDIVFPSFVHEVIEGIEQTNFKNVTVINEIENVAVPGDVQGMKQVFSNLITNAYKYNKQDGALRIYSEKETTAEGRYITFIFEDTGLGIPAEDVNRVFERFYRVEKARSRDMGGTGLGLSIVKNIVKAHKGKVWVESIEGQGSKFFLRLPL